MRVRRFLSAYYVGNALVLASYVALRALAEQADERASTQLKTFVRFFPQTCCGD
jgi:hypothetical protein